MFAFKVKFTFICTGLNVLCRHLLFTYSYLSALHSTQLHIPHTHSSPLHHPHTHSSLFTFFPHSLLTSSTSPSLTPPSPLLHLLPHSLLTSSPSPHTHSSPLHFLPTLTPHLFNFSLTHSSPLHIPHTHSSPLYFLPHSSLLTSLHFIFIELNFHRGIYDTRQKECNKRTVAAVPLFSHQKRCTLMAALPPCKAPQLAPFARLRHLLP